MNVTIRYFALFREQAGREEEILTIEPCRVGELYEQLRTSRGLSLDSDRVRFARNDQYCGHECMLTDGDRVVFIPPLSGG